MPFLDTPLDVWEEVLAVKPDWAVARVPGGGPPDGVAGRARSHHQRLLGARGPGYADQLPLLRRQGRPAHANADHSRGAGTARRHRQQRCPGLALGVIETPMDAPLEAN